MSTETQGAYFFAHDTQGKLAVQMHEPYPGGVTIAWVPSADYGGKRVEFHLPLEIFDEILRQLITSRAQSELEPKIATMVDAQNEKPWEVPAKPPPLKPRK